MTTPDHVEKLMSLTPQEFIDTLARLSPSTRDFAGAHVLPVAGGTVRIEFTPQTSVTLGGLLALPRAKVTISFDGVDNAARDAFLKRFELAFQRGGG
jgi:hypothetical protein